MAERAARFAIPAPKDAVSTKDMKKATKKRQQKKRADSESRENASGTDEMPRAKKAKHVEGKADEGAVQAFLAKHEITIHEENAAPPCLSFGSAPFPQELVKLLQAQPGFRLPSAVQAATWPIAVSGRDVLAIAKTGSGKTLGFLLPVLTRCSSCSVIIELPSAFLNCTSA